MKRVIVPMALTGEGPNENAVVRSSYLAKLFARDTIPVPVSPQTPWSLLERLYVEADGVLLLGGVDFDPSTYGAERNPHTRTGPIARDYFELRLIRRAVSDRKPLLAICRGAQGLAIALGGTLHQHIPDTFPNERHQSEHPTDYALATAFYHPVTFNPGSRIARICGTLHAQMNSAHHQAIDDPGTQLIATGWSPEGCIEFVEHRNPDYFCLGVQAHPEMMPEPQAHAIFDEFVAALSATSPSVSAALVGAP